MNKEAKDILITNRMIGDFKLRDAIDVAVKALDQEKNEDCISRNEALSLFKPRGITDEVWEECDVYKKLTALPSVSLIQKWIPVSERLPEVGSQVLVCYEFNKKRYMYIADFYGDGKFHELDYDWVDDVVAWMPLPTPPNKSEIPIGAESEE